MKKLISVIMSVVLIALSLCSGFTAFAAPLQEERESKELNSFINGIVSLAREYDADKEFTVPENDETMQIQAFSAENTTDETTDNDTSKYTLQDFQTARLIVRTNGKFNKHGALEDISGFEDFHILQYESPEEAMSAYTDLQAEKNITNVAPDEVVAPLQGEKVETLTASEISEKDYLCDWSVDRTQSKRLQEYLAKSDISMKDVTVGVVDDGVHYDNEFVRDRIERTNFNSSQSGTANDEYGSPDGHGTAVCSIIADNTPSNVKIKCYKVIDDDGFSPITHVFAGYIAAVNDGVDVISVSLAYYDDTDLTESFVRIAYKNNIPVFGGMGNDGRLDYNLVPANVPECIAVSATDDNNTVTLWTTFSDGADISAPGQSICVAMGANEYDVWSGTSFSTPCAAALGAILKAQNPDITVDKLEERIKSTSFDVKRYNDCESWRDYEENMYGSFTDNYYSLFDGVGMVQFSDAFGLPELAMPEYNLKDALYINAQKCSITCKDKNATVLYTTDGTYPALENAYKYTEPFDVTQRTRIRAVAYYADSGYYSRDVEITPRIQYMDSDDAYTITDNGIITNYSGSVSDLYIQDEINNIEVKGIAKGAFDNSELIGLTLPDSVTEISESAFYNNDSLEFIRGVGVEYVGTNAFANSALKYAEFPNAKEIANLSFKQTKHFCKGDFSKLEKIGTRAFQRSNIISFNGPEVKEIEQGVFEECLRLEVVRIPKCKKYISKLSGYNGDFYSDKYLLIAEMPLIENLLRGALEDTCIKEANYPFLKEMQKRAFYNCTNLKVINTPMLKVVPENAFNGTLVNIGNTVPRIYYLDSVTQIEQDAFGEYPTSRIEFSHLETAQSLPQTEGCIIAMPSTFKECTVDTKGRNYKVYGTKGTYAEQWANENGHEFINISQDTAVLTQLPEQYTDADDVLTADVIGFNRTYQWYASDKPDNTAGTPIEGATDREFNPEDYPAAKYYYCVVTSTDVGYDPIEIRTGVTENMTLNPADYSKVEKAKSEIPEDLSLYTDESVKALQDILDNIDYSLDETEQSKVDDYAKAIEEAVNSLEYKPADYTEYNKAVEKAKSLGRNLYQDLTALDNALSVDVKDKNITEQAVIDKQTKAIEDAINSLEYKPADYSKLDSALAQVPEDLSIYTDESVERLNSVIESLNYDLKITQQDEADKQVEALLEAIGALEKRYILGDVNLDGEITILDAKWVLQNIVRLRSLGGLSLKAADMNQDGKITILDARLILFAVTR